MLKVLVTGAGGFIGSNLIRSLLHESSYFIYALIRDKPSSFSEHDRLKYIYCDLSSADFADSLPDNIHTVLHLAQSTNYRQFPEKSDDIFAINIQSTHKLLEWSRKSGVKRFLFASSGNVYRTSNKPLSEDDICKPSGFYGKTKYIGELLVNSYSNFFEVSILRIFGVYGPGQTGMLVSNIIERVKNNEQVTLGQNVGLEFTPLYIDDCVNMIHKVLINEGKHTIYNLCGLEKVSLASLAEEIGLAVNINPKFKINETTPIRLIGDNNRFITEFDYRIQFDLKAGINKTVNTNQ